MSLRAVVSAGVPTRKRVTSLRLSTGKLLLWNAAVVSTLADAYVSITALRTGAAAELASIGKAAKHAHFTESYFLSP